MALESNREKMEKGILRLQEKQEKLERFRREVAQMEKRIRTVRLFFSPAEMQQEGSKYHDALKGQTVSKRTIAGIAETYLKLLARDVSANEDCLSQLKGYGLSKLEELQQGTIIPRLSPLVGYTEILSYIGSFLDLVNSMCAAFQARLQSDLYHVEREMDDVRAVLQEQAEREVNADMRNEQIVRAMAAITPERIRRTMLIADASKHRDGFLLPDAFRAMEEVGLNVWEPSRVVKRILELAGFNTDRIRVRSHNRTWVVLGADDRPVKWGNWGDVLNDPLFKKAYQKYRLERRKRDDLEDD